MLSDEILGLISESAEERHVLARREQTGATALVFKTESLDMERKKKNPKQKKPSVPTTDLESVSFSATYHSIQSTTNPDC